MDRRGNRRRRFRVSLRLEPGRVSSMTGDVSTGGVFVHSARVHRPGTKVRLEIRTGDGTARALGVVRWAKRVPVHLMPHVRGGMGIEFTWISAEFETYLADLLAPARAAV